MGIVSELDSDAQCWRAGVQSERSPLRGQNPTQWALFPPQLWGFNLSAWALFTHIGLQKGRSNTL